MLDPEPSPCVDDGLRSAAACGSAFLALAAGASPAVLLLAGVGCAGQILGLFECHAEEANGVRR